MTSIPRVHIVIAGIEKIVPNFTDGLTVVRTASTYGCGQDIGTFCLPVVPADLLGRFHIQWRLVPVNDG